MVAVVLTTWSVARSVDATRRRWGDSVDVLVATTAVRPGDALEGRVDLARWPVALVPDDALDVLSPGVVARHHIGRGEVVTEADAGSRGGVAGLVPSGWSVAHVRATADQRAVVSVGDAVAVVVGGRRISTGVAVAVGTESVAVAVPDEVVATVTQGVIDGVAALALAPGR